MLLMLPTEVLALIFHNLIRCIGIRHSVHSRLVCHIFNLYVLDAIYALPTFEDPDGDYPAHVTWDVKMSKAMVARLIQAKLRNQEDERALSREITRTVNFIMGTLDDVEKEVYEDGLVHLAADNLPTYEIIRSLSRSPNALDSSSGQLENALVVALRRDQLLHIQALLDLGARAHCRTKWFGDALHVAACYAAVESFLLILRKCLGTEHKIEKRLAASRLVMALEQAAAHGRAEIFCTDLCTVVEETYDHSTINEVFEPAITSATLACHDNVVLAILALLNDHPRNFLDASNDKYWVQVLRLAASNGSESTVQLILDNTATANVKGSLNLPFEDACRTGSERIVKLLLARSTGHNLDSYAGSMYWAARGTHYDILKLIVRSLASSRVLYLEDALCGAAVHGASAMATVFEIVTEKALQARAFNLEGKRFAQIVDMVAGANDPINSVPNRGVSGLRTVPPTVPEDDLLQDMLSGEHLQLAQACREGALWAACDIVAHFGDEDTAASNYSAGAFSESIAHQHPGILQYLCEKFSRTKHFTVEAALNVQSTAIFQILLDHGWTANVASSRLKPPILGNMTKSEELTRWFLNHGGDPNSRCDWDITPVSVAVDKASLSTIRLMFDYGGDVRKGQLLHFAMERKSLDQLAVIDMLISFGIPLDARMFEDDPNSWLENKSFGMGAPLHTAVDRGNADAVAYLLWRGANCEKLDTAGRMPLDIAQGKGDCMIAELIQSSMSTFISRSC